VLAETNAMLEIASQVVRDNSATFAQDISISTCAGIHYQACLRNKQCLLAYLCVGGAVGRQISAASRSTLALQDGSRQMYAKFPLGNGKHSSPRRHFHQLESARGVYPFCLQRRFARL
jgi:hypothetical protein